MPDRFSRFTILPAAVLWLLALPVACGGGNGGYRVDLPDVTIHVSWQDARCDHFATVLLSASDAGAGATYSWIIESLNGVFLESGRERTHEYNHNCQVNGNRFVARLEVSTAGGTDSNGHTVIVPR